MLRIGSATIATVLALAATLSAVTEAVAQRRFNMKQTERAFCRLGNVERGRNYYEGPCYVTESTQGRRQSFVIRMRGADPVTLFRVGQGEYIFAGSDGETQVRYADRGETGVFRWDNMRLEITNRD